MKNLLLLILLTNLFSLSSQTDYGDYKLIWSDEFEGKNSMPDSTKWSFENGFVRNEEFQWYQSENAFVRHGKLIIEGRKQLKLNPGFNPSISGWRSQREYAEYTSSSLHTSGKFQFRFGILEVRARIDTSMGLWPAIWTLGIQKEWPSNGEADLMESYPIDGQHYILANIASGTNKRFRAKWDSEKHLLSNFIAKDPQWPQKFHVWKMIWDETKISLLLDDQLLNETLLCETVNPDGFQPFNQPHYILLNLAIGGLNGGDPSKTKFPSRYEIDYVRVYQK
jgi:beta-glucanase (GH16 family)